MRPLHAASRKTDHDYLSGIGSPTDSVLQLRVQQLVAPTYHLIRPIFGFWSDSGQVITIPARAVIRPVIIKDGLGLCTALWEGRLVMAYREDIDRNGLSLRRLADNGEPDDPAARSGLSPVHD